MNNSFKLLLMVVTLLCGASCGKEKTGSEPENTIVTISQERIEFPARGGETSVEVVSSSGGWDARSSDSFISLSCHGNTSHKGSLTVKADLNPGMSGREGEVTVFSGNARARLRVVQTGAERPQLEKSIKRGIGENEFSREAQLNALQDGISWYYNWGAEPSRGVANITGPDKEIEFVPMAWNASGINAVRKYVSSHPGVKYILGFNEPNFKSQANMLPSQAATAWKELEKIAVEYGVALVAPALNYTDSPLSDGVWYQPNDWMDAFIAAYKEANGGKSPRMDYLALHCYMNHESAMIGYVEDFAKRYGKKVWLTEFCSWEGSVSQQEQLASMPRKLAKLEKSPYVYRYAWFKAVGKNESPYFRLLDGDNLTELGQEYIRFKHQ